MTKTMSALERLREYIPSDAHSVPDDAQCAECGTAPQFRICRDCRVNAAITDCGHLPQPRPIALASDGGIGDMLCDDCAVRHEIIAAFEDEQRQRDERDAKIRELHRRYMQNPHGGKEEKRLATLTLALLDGEKR